MRPIWRILLRALRKNKKTPTNNSSGVKTAILEFKICATIADPKSAPRIIARPAVLPTDPAAMNPARSIATAVELCRKIAESVPVVVAVSLLSVDRRSQSRSCPPKALSNPVRTTRTDQINSAAADARFNTKSIGDVSIVFTNSSY